ncbi:MAG TPA: hypothetical protein ENJ95_13410 [Bacteroidetes bacterium]|nr:hypothetical protein [Bacteroidota bacterium]
MRHGNPIKQKAGGVGRAWRKGRRVVNWERGNKFPLCRKGMEVPVRIGNWQGLPPEMGQGNPKKQKSVSKPFQKSGNLFPLPVGMAWRQGRGVVNWQGLPPEMGQGNPKKQKSVSKPFQKSGNLFPLPVGMAWRQGRRVVNWQGLPPEVGQGNPKKQKSVSKPFQKSGNLFPLPF